MASTSIPAYTFYKFPVHSALIIEHLHKINEIEATSMLHGHDNIEMDTIHGHVMNSQKYTWYVSDTRFGYGGSMVGVFILHRLQDIAKIRQLIFAIRTKPLSSLVEG